MESIICIGCSERWFIEYLKNKNLLEKYNVYEINNFGKPAFKGYKFIRMQDPENFVPPKFSEIKKNRKVFVFLGLRQSLLSPFTDVVKVLNRNGAIVITCTFKIISDLPDKVQYLIRKVDYEAIKKSMEFLSDIFVFIDCLEMEVNFPKISPFEQRINLMRIFSKNKGILDCETGKTDKKGE